MAKQINLDECRIIDKYKEVASRMLKYSFPHISNMEIDQALNYSINKRFKNTDIVLENNYKKKNVNSTLLEVADYILKREPIITAYGVMFKKHGTEPNPIADLLKSFMEGRDVYKKEMFKYPKGSDQFEKYNLLQLLSKLDSNGFYGAQAAPTCVYFNFYVASSITTQGRSAISAATLLFEAFLSNNVKFRSLNEVITFIDNVVQEKKIRKYNDKLILDRDITLAEAFNKVMLTCGFDYIPTENDLNIVWEIMMRLSQEDLNRLYYKNNLYDFMDNKTMTNAIILLLSQLEKPYMDPNKKPKEIEAELDQFYELLEEYVFYNHQVIDRIDRITNMIRNVSIINDTDSSIVSFDAWYNFIMPKVQHLPLKIKYREFGIEYFDKDDYGNLIPEQGIEFLTEQEVDYDFMDEEVVMRKRAVSCLKIIPPDGIRYSIINILANCVSRLVNKHMETYTKQSHSWDESKKCLLYLKNEFLMFRILLKPDAKKNYASDIELQEGNIIPNNMNAKLDVKGLPSLLKSTMNESTKNRLKKILYEDILTSEQIDQIKILKDISILEKDIFNSLSSGSKEYYKPAVIKSADNYEDPMRIQGIKSSMVFNKLKNDNEPLIDLDKRNVIDIAKVNISKKNAHLIKDSFPLVYDRLMELLDQPQFETINSIAIPYGEDVPDWIKPFIDYITIINDCISGFPLDSCGLYFSGGNNNYTNILQI